MSEPVEGRVRRALVGANVPVGEDFPSAQPLPLDSFLVVALHEQLETVFDVRIRASEVTPDNFQSIAALCALMERVVAA